MTEPVKSSDPIACKPQIAADPAKKTASRKLAVWFVRGLGICGLLIFILLAALYYYLQSDPQKLADRYLSGLSQKTGLEFSIGSVEVTLLPLPAIAVSDLRVTGNGLLFTTPWAQAAPNFRKIFRGNFFPGTITILRPRLSCSLDFPLDDFSRIRKLFENIPAGNSGDLPEMEVDILDLGAKITGSNGDAISLSGLEARLDILPENKIDIESRFISLMLAKKNEWLGSIEKFSLYGQCSITDFLTDTRNLSAAGYMRIKDALRNSRFNLKFESSSHGWSSAWQTRGNFDLAGEKIPFGFHGRLIAVAPYASLVARGIDWRLGPDSGGLELTLSLPTEKSGFELRGLFLGHRISLTEWLGFARNLPPGLQLALDNITHAKADFLLNQKGLSVSNIRAACSGSTFKGSGGVPDWKKPSVNLDLVTDMARLGTGLPESVGESPDAPYFPHPTLTPMPGAPLQPGETGIDYDIRLAAKDLLYGPIKIRNASLRVYPGKLDATGLQDVLLDGKGELYDGKITGHCILGADPSLPYYISASAKNVNGAALGKAMPVIPLRQGTYDGSAIVTSRGKELNTFLKNLSGDMKVSGQNARLAAPAIAFTSLSAAGKLRSGQWTGKQLIFDGKWTTDLKTTDWNANGALDGKLSFGRSGVTLASLPATMNATLNGIEPFPKGTKVRISAKLSGNSDQNRFRADDFAINMAGISIKGDAAIDAAKEECSGSFTASAPDLNDSLASLGLGGAKLPAQLTRMNLDGAFHFLPDNIKLSEMKGKLGSLTVGGMAQWQKKEDRPAFSLDLGLGSITIAELLPQSSSSTSWDFPGMTKFDASGNIRLQALNAYDVRFQNMKAAFSLKNGKMEISPLSANFYGAPLNATANMNFGKGLEFTVSSRVNAFDLGAAVRDATKDVIVTGTANLQANMGAKLNGKARLVEKLNGQWNISAANGSWQSVDKNMKPAGDPVKFAKASASGTVENGIVRSENFVLASPSLTVSGGGWLNLSTRKMDCTFNVNMRGLPNFPIYVYGPLNDLNKRIGAGKMIMNAVSGAATGFVNAIGGVIKGAWNIFGK